MFCNLYIVLLVTILTGATKKLHDKSNNGKIRKVLDLQNDSNENNFQKDKSILKKSLPNADDADLWKSYNILAEKLDNLNKDKDIKYKKLDQHLKNSHISNENKDATTADKKFVSLSEDSLLKTIKRNIGESNESYQRRTSHSEKEVKNKRDKLEKTDDNRVARNSEYKKVSKSEKGKNIYSDKKVSHFLAKSLSSKMETQNNAFDKEDKLLNDLKRKATNVNLKNKNDKTLEKFKLEKLFRHKIDASKENNNIKLEEIIEESNNNNGKSSQENLKKEIISKLNKISNSGLAVEKTKNELEKQKIDTDLEVKEGRSLDVSMNEMHFKKTKSSSAFAQAIEKDAEKKKNDEEKITLFDDKNKDDSDKEEKKDENNIYASNIKSDDNNNKNDHNKILKYNIYEFEDNDDDDDDDNDDDDNDDDEEEEEDGDDDNNNGDDTEDVDNGDSDDADDTNNDETTNDNNENTDAEENTENIDNNRHQEDLKTANTDADDDDKKNSDDNVNNEDERKSDNDDNDEKDEGNDDYKENYLKKDRSTKHRDMTLEKVDKQKFEAKQVGDPCGTSAPLVLQSEGSLNSPGFSSNLLPKSAKCSWKIIAPAGKVVKLSFSVLSMEQSNLCEYDSVIVFDVVNSAGLKIGRYCGNVLPAELLKSSGQMMFVYFVSDDINNVGKFTFSWTFVNPQIPTPSIASCGLPKVKPLGVNYKRREDRIVNGQVAKAHSWPWQISLRLVIQGKTYHICGGTIVSPTIVLTAAHCLYDDKHIARPFSTFSIVAGDHDQLTTSDGATQAPPIKRLIIHPQYNPASASSPYDIAIFELSAPGFSFNDNVLPACLPAETVANNDVCFSTGWGDTKGTGKETILNQVLLPIISQTTCSQNDHYGNLVNPTMVCAGYEEGGKDACQGDSGGPFVCLRNNRWYLQGITSFGDGCAKAKRPGIYTRVTSYLAWIKTNAGISP